MADQIKITLPDGSQREYETGATPAEVAASIGKGLAKAALAARVDDEWYDLDRPIGHDATVAVITPDTPEGREVLRHSTAHVMAQAVTDLYPGARYAIGPAIADGFYYDFELPGGGHFTEDDLERVEARMREIVTADQPFQRAELSRADGLALFDDQPFKREIIERVQPDDELEVGAGDVISVYRNPRDGADPFVDLCRGPHVPSTKRLGASTAPPGSRRPPSTRTCTSSRRPSAATTVSSGSSSISSRSRPRSAAGSPCSIPRVGWCAS
jgi:threonyl-tRNA synthetase